MIKYIVFPLLKGLIISGCASSENDKYAGVSKEEKKIIKKVCGCIEPLMPLVKKMINAQSTGDTASAVIYADSLQLISKGVDSCIGNADLLESKSFNDEKHAKLVIEYITKKYPDCVPFFLGVKNFQQNIFKEDEK